ncbi:MAG: ATP-binding cassette domain-containing protein [Candidatus Hydrogenedentota bacterium]|nr:MAG: ATP-binding cassette domain-containing protein [Candidatus Hydrogenedentota bacterium]
MTSNSILLEASHLSMKFGKRTLFLDLNFQIYQGEWVAIVGPSGYGKSTLLYILAGMQKPTKGKLYFQQTSLYQKSIFYRNHYRNQNVGFLYQDFRLIPYWTVKRNIFLPAFFSKQQIKNHLDELLKMFSIEHIANKKVRTISGGEAQRTALARAVLLKPKLLLLDEPTGNLDLHTEKEILSHIQTLQKTLGLTIISVTHSKEVMKHAKKIIEFTDQGVKIRKKRK